jgi:uncharacterized protein YndB with AHSA1/START domain
VAFAGQYERPRVCLRRARGRHIPSIAHVPRPSAFTQGQTSEDSDTYQGRFVELVPYAKIVEVIQFESHDPAFAGEIRMIVSLADADGGTEVTVLCEGIPEGIRCEDNELGCKESLQKLAALLE